MRIELIIPALLLFWNCSSSGVSTDRYPSGNDPESPVQKPTDLPKVGFNCKASYNIIEQTAYADELFAKLGSAVLQNMVLRIPGGTRSQKDFAADWPDAKMKLWIDLQQKYGYTMVYVVNGNDAPANQLAIIRRWQENGAEFAFLEMMTEYYLPKFSKPDLRKPEVTRRVDAGIYTTEILPAFYAHLDSLDLPYFLIFAPAKMTKTGAERYADWNSHMIAYVNGLESAKNLGVVLHLYQKDYESAYDYGQIDRLREALPDSMPFAVTELGVLDRDVPSGRHPAETVRHIDQVVKRLNGNDYLMDQVVYHDYPNNPMANTHPKYGGVSPKGEAVTEYYNELFDVDATDR